MANFYENNGDRNATWEDDVPPPIVEVIKNKKLFGWSGK